MERNPYVTPKVAAATARVIAGEGLRTVYRATGVSRTSIYRELKRLGYHKDGAAWVPRTKHEDCEDRCQLLEHKGYHTCAQTGRCEMLNLPPASG